MNSVSPVTLLCRLISLAFSEASLLVTGVIIFVLMKNRRVAFQLIATLLVVSSTVGLLKAVFRIPRPPASGWLVEAYGYSFPSGHAAAAAVLALFLADVWGPRVFPASILLAVCISLSRIVLGVHWPADIAGGILLGVASYVVVRVISDRAGWLNLLLMSGLYSVGAGVVALALDPANYLVWVLTMTSAGFTLGLYILVAMGRAGNLEYTASPVIGLTVLAVAVLLWGVALADISNGMVSYVSLLSSFLAGLIIVLARATDTG